MTIHVSIDDNLAAEVRKVADSMGLSIDHLIRDYLQKLASSATIEAELEELERLSEEAKGDSHGWKFNRDEIYELS
jgi:antitoxin component of RelBE/YafQ-DinJ toxin-antitoxin module